MRWHSWGLASLGAGLALVSGSVGVANVAEASTRTAPLLNGRLAGPAAPLITSAGPEGLGILVDWVPASAAVKVTSYQLRAKPVVTPSVPAACKASVTSTVPGADTMTILGHVCAQVAYRVMIEARTAAITSAYSRPSNPIVPLAASVPLIPLVANVFGRNHSLAITWVSPAYNGGSPVRSYQVTAKSPTSTKTVTEPAAARAATIRGLTNGTPYTVVLRAVNAVGKSPAATGRGTPGPPHAPGPPTGLSAVPGSGTRTMAVSWTAPTNDGGERVTSYRLTWLREIAKARGKAIVYKPAPGAKLMTRTVAGTSILLRGLSAKAVFYVFRVAARNAAGVSAPTRYSRPVTLRTAASARTRVLGPKVLAHVRGYAGGVLTVVYPTASSVPPVLRSLRARDVIVAGISKLTPEGLLRTVRSVTARKPGRYVIITGPASLSSAFRTLTADVSLGPSALHGTSAGRFIAGSPGISVRQVPQAGVSTTLDLSVDVSAAAQGNQGGLTYDIQGDVQLTPALDLETSLLRGWAGLPDGAGLSFTATLGVTESHSVSVSGTLQQQWPVGAGAGLYPPDLRPKEGIYCYGTFDVQLGPVPLVLTPCVEINITFSVTGQISFTSSVHFFYGEKASWTSANPGALTLTSLSQKPAAGSPPSTSQLLQVQGSFGLDVKPELFLYGVTGPYIDASIGLALAVAPASRPWLTLALQLTISAGWQVVIGFLGINVHVQAAATASWMLYQSTGPPPTSLAPPLPISPPDAAVSPGASQQFTAPGSTGSVTWSLSGQAGDNITSAGLFTAAAPAGRVVTITATDSTGATGSAVISIGTGIGPPRDLSGTPISSGTRAVLTWQAPVPAAGQTIASYTISTSPPTAVTTAPGTATGATISGLSPGADYVISVSAWTTTGLESPPATVIFTAATPYMELPADASGPILTRDGKTVIYADAAGKYWRMPLDGGPRTPLLDGITGLGNPARCWVASASATGSVVAAVCGNYVYRVDIARKSAHKLPGNSVVGMTVTPSVSADGTRVLYDNTADLAGHPAKTDAAADHLYVYDSVTNAVTLIPMWGPPPPPGHGTVSDRTYLRAVLSGDGRTVAAIRVDYAYLNYFVNTQNVGASGPYYGYFNPYEIDFDRISISDNGSVVAWEGSAFSGTGPPFVHVAVTCCGEPGSYQVGTLDSADAPFVSPDGRSVIYSTVAGDTNELHRAVVDRSDSSVQWDVATDLSNPPGGQPITGESFIIGTDETGNRLLFDSTSTNLVPNQKGRPGYTHFFIRM